MTEAKFAVGVFNGNDDDDDDDDDDSNIEDGEDGKNDVTDVDTGSVDTVGTNDEIELDGWVDSRATLWFT